MTLPTSEIDYAAPADVLDRLAKLERELWVWRVLGVCSIILGMMLFCAGLWALGRAGVF